jgi:hypothetical protein
LYEYIAKQLAERLKARKVVVWYVRGGAKVGHWSGGVMLLRAA